MSDSSAVGTARRLPANPNITQLKNQAKDLKRGVTGGDAAALSRARLWHPLGDGVDPGSFTLRDAQLTIAREHGFEGWHQLNSEVGERMIEQRDLHRWLGVQLNNRMWDRIDNGSIVPDLTQAEREDLLYSAYASAYHWRQVGNEANQARGEHLISRMAVGLGESSLALRHARRCLELVATHPEVMEDWDAAFAHEAMARALAANGEVEEARSHREEAMRRAAALSQEEDRAIVDAELAREPWFGLV
jgi:hypothetical protein